MEKKTKYGLIELDDRIFLKIIKDSVKKTDGITFLHEKKGNVHISCDEDLNLSFEIDIKFGSSIKRNTDIILDYIEENIKSLNLEKKTVITVYVKGMILAKAKSIVDRNIELKREF